MANLTQHAPEAPALDNDSLIERRRRLTALAVLSVALGLCAGATQHHTRRVTWPIQTATVHSHRARTGIDPNTAEWFKLAQLPRIGEIVAKRIVTEREDHPPEVGRSPQVFQKPSDLTRVRGIGEKTILRLGPFLRFSDTGNRR